MRILYMVFHFPPISGGGVIVVTKLANTLAEMGHEITVITPDLYWDGEKFEPKLDSNIQVIRTITPSKNNIKIAARRCYQNMKDKGIEEGLKKKYDFVFSIFHPFHLAPKAAVSCAEELQIPSIIKIDDALYGKSSGLKSIQRMIEKRYNSQTLQHASRVLVPNEHTKDVVKNFYSVKNENLAIVPNGVDLEKFSSIKENKKRIIFSGVMYNHRGLDVLINASTKIVKNHPDAEIILIGNGPELENLKNQVKTMKLDSNIKFYGWIDHDKIPDILLEGSIGIGPLRSTKVTQNALPIKVLEYLAASLPIIAIEGTLPPDVLIDGRNGFFVRNSSELAEKIVYLLDDIEKIKEFGSNSKKMVEKFDWKNVCKQILDEYSKC